MAKFKDFFPFITTYTFMSMWYFMLTWYRVKVEITIQIVFYPSYLKINDNRFIIIFVILIFSELDHVLWLQLPLPLIALPFYNWSLKVFVAMLTGSQMATLDIEIILIMFYLTDIWWNTHAQKLINSFIVWIPLKRLLLYSFYNKILSMANVCHLNGKMALPPILMVSQLGIG